MLAIRRGMFETNSSSCHSVSISSKGALEAPDYKGRTFKVESGEFGWEVDSHYDLHSKVSYAYAYIQTQEGSYYADENEHIELREDLRNMLKEVIMEQTGAKNVKFVKLPGYIDHQSVDEASKIFESKKSLRNFLFNPKSSVRTDNDNH